TSLLLLSPVLRLPAELSKDVTVVDLPLPDTWLLARSLSEILASLPGDVAVRLGAGDREQLVRSAQGLTVKELANVLAKAVVTKGAVDRSAIDLINAEKRQIIRKSG